MPQFIIGYLGSPKPASPEAGAAHMANGRNGWKGWETRSSARVAHDGNQDRQRRRGV